MSFEQVAEIRDVAGMIVAVITAKARNNGTYLYSYTFVREFDDKGQRKRTSYLNVVNADALARLLPLVLTKIQELSTPATEIR